MARSISTIQTSMDTEQAAQTSLSTLNSTSQTAIYTLWKNIVATVSNYLEQLMDAKKTEIETILTNNVFGSPTWVRNKCFEFQYDSTIPQVIQIIDNVPTYATIDATKRVVTRCAVSSSAGTCSILVAKGDGDTTPLAALSTPEKDALSSYFNAGGTSFGQEIGIGAAGVVYAVSSLDPDRMFIECEIFYNGTYAGTIEADTVTALENYMANLTFGGDVVVTSLIDYLQTIPGFSDVFINGLAIRSSITPFASKTFLIDTDKLLLKSSTTIAGYIIEEDTVGETFLDKITFTAI